MSHISIVESRSLLDQVQGALTRSPVKPGLAHCDTSLATTDESQVLGATSWWWDPSS
jgi:hypothetical protein